MWSSWVVFWWVHYMNQKCPAIWSTHGCSRFLKLSTRLWSQATSRKLPWSWGIELAALWLGVVISGSLEQIIRAARAGHFPVVPEAAAWTDIPQSFIFVKPQPVTSRTENFLGIISRSRECQLLHLADPHRRLIPSMPWKPFGNTSIGDTDLIVRKLAKCLGHCLKYQSWSWELNDDTHTVEDLGLQTLLQDQEQQASRDDSEDLGLHLMHRVEQTLHPTSKEIPGYNHIALKMTQTRLTFAVAGASTL